MNTSLPIVALVLGVLGVVFVSLNPEPEVEVRSDGQVVVEIWPHVIGERSRAVLVQRGHQHFWVWEKEWEPILGTGWPVRYLDEVYAEYLLQQEAAVRATPAVIEDQVTVDVPASVSDVPEMSDVGE